MASSARSRSSVSSSQRPGFHQVLQVDEIGLDLGPAVVGQSDRRELEHALGPSGDQRDKAGSLARGLESNLRTECKRPKIALDEYRSYGSCRTNSMSRSARRFMSFMT